MSLYGLDIKIPSALDFHIVSGTRTEYNNLMKFQLLGNALYNRLTTTTAEHDATLQWPDHNTETYLWSPAQNLLMLAWQDFVLNNIH